MSKFTAWGKWRRWDLFNPAPQNPIYCCGNSTKNRTRGWAVFAMGLLCNGAHQLGVDRNGSIRHIKPPRLSNTSTRPHPHQKWWKKIKKLTLTKRLPWVLRHSGGLYLIYIPPKNWEHCLPTLHREHWQSERLMCPGTHFPYIFAFVPYQPINCLSWLRGKKKNQ